MDKNKGYKQGWLSAYFGIIPRSRQSQYGHEARSAWLDKHFGGLEVIPSGSQYLAVLPQAFKLAVAPFSYFEVMIGKHMEVTPDRLEVASDSLTESVGRLHRAVLNHVLEEGALDLYVPKQGQSSDIIVSGKQYLCIHQHDPLHNHASTDLIDFVSVEVSPVLQRVHRLDFEYGHSHLIDPKLVI